MWNDVESFLEKSTASLAVLFSLSFCCLTLGIQESIPAVIRNVDNSTLEAWATELAELLQSAPEWTVRCGMDNHSSTFKTLPPLSAHEKPGYAWLIEAARRVGCQQQLGEAHRHSISCLTSALSSIGVTQVLVTGLQHSYAG